MAGRMCAAAGRMAGVAALPLVVLAASWLSIARVAAMEARAVDDQLILSGDVVADDVRQIQTSLDAHPAVTTVILRNSHGGDAVAGYRVGELFRQRGLTTAVSGYCVSSCSRMLLGGRVRAFTDDYPDGDTRVGFHGHYDDDGRLRPEFVRKLGLKAWILRFSDGKADEALVERWINIPVGGGAAWFYPTSVASARGSSAFFCSGTEAVHIIAQCERLPQSALQLGVITTLDLVHSNDQPALRASLVRPPASGFATIADENAVPLTTQPGRDNYRAFLQSDLPRAFAMTAEGDVWAWNSRGGDTMESALRRCAARAGRACRLYAVDQNVVWPAR